MADELKRRLTHASGSLLVALYLLGAHLEVMTWRSFQALMVVGSVVVAILEFIRLRVGLDWWIYEQLTREYEQDNVAAYALYIFSMTAVVLAFDPQIALPAMLMLAIGDPVSGAFSADSLERVKPPRVLVSMFLVCCAIGLLFLEPVAAVAAAVGATLADGVTLEVRTYIIDDNLTIPIYAAVAAYAVLAVA